MSMPPDESRAEPSSSLPVRRGGALHSRDYGEPMPAPEMPRLTMPPPGTAAGIEAEELAARPSSTEPVRVTCVDYSPEQVLFEDVHDIPSFLARHRPPWSRVRWINIDGLGNMDVIHAFAVKYQLHPLAIEDVLHRVQAPKAEDYPGSEDQPGRLFVVARTIEEHGGRLRSDQVSFFLGRTTLLTFHEAHAEDVEAVRARIRTPGSRLRQNDVSFLLYVLLDGIVDHLFPVLERYSERLEDVEEQLLARPSQETLQQIHAIKRELLLVRRAAWPLRELVAQLQRDKHECLSETAQTYLRDVYDHCVQIIDLVETYREIASGLAETYISVVSNRTNEIMKVLTVIGTIFIPLTFLAGVYGMNMPIPENASPLTYPAFWVVCAGVAGGMLLWFRRRGWL
ncbi:MAG: magnesium/cobalt transporter CorA [Chloroflexi bacterium]|jgi:magnesium transporter|nr:magnesium/cobalt transporter CorA [Chloroflexota bacterium]